MRPLWISPILMWMGIAYLFVFLFNMGIFLFWKGCTGASSVVTQSLQTSVSFDLFLFRGRLLRLWPSINEIISTGSLGTALIHGYLMSWLSYTSFPQFPRAEPTLTRQRGRMYRSGPAEEHSHHDCQLLTTLEEVSPAILMWLDNHCF